MKKRTKELPSDLVNILTKTDADFDEGSETPSSFVIFLCQPAPPVMKLGMSITLLWMSPDFVTTKSVWWKIAVLMKQIRVKQVIKILHIINIS